MFGKPTNPYDEIISKATDEKQTEINWETALTVWDKVNEDGETGARNSVNALTKRLTHRSANVQLFSLTLAGALVNNCGPSLHREISGKAFTQALVRLINDRTTHESVKKEALKSIEEWVKEHKNNSDFDLLNDTYESLKRQNHKFPSTITRNPTPPRINDEALRREEEDLQRALAESAALSNPLRGFQPSSSSSSQSTPTSKSLPSEPSPQNPTRVRALYDFTGQTHEELEFKRGDLIRVVECLYEDWWKGENLSRRGRVGIFPRNHVEPVPEEEEPQQQAQPPQQVSLTEEELEGEVFAQVALVDRLLGLMNQLRDQGQDFADNDELTDLYNSSMRLRPRVVKLIRKYDQKQADLENMSRKVDQARGIYEGMMGQRTTQPPQAVPHGYPQGQTNGYQPHPSHHPAQQDPYQRTFSPSHASNSVPPPHQAQLPPHHQQQVPAQQQGGLDSAAAAIEEQQRREYEQKWQEYERQMEEYNRQMAAHQQFYQQQQQQGGGPVPTGSVEPQAGQPQPQQAYPSDPHAHAASLPPPVGASSSSDPHSHPPHPSTPPIPSSVQPPQPQWDGQAWVWPAQVAQVAALPPPVATSPVPSLSTTQHAPPPQLAHSLSTRSIASPPPNMAIYSSPPPGSTHPQLHQQQQGISSLTEGIAGIGLNGGQHLQQQGYYPGGGGGGGEDPAQAQWAR